MKAYFKSILLHRVSRRFSQNVALHLHARQLSAQPTDFHLLGTHGLAVGSFEFALLMRVDPVEQRLVNHPSVLATTAIVFPPSTSLTAFCLNSSV